jgi:hypothetical protein
VIPRLQISALKLYLELLRTSGDIQKGVPITVSLKAKE